MSGLLGMTMPEAGGLLDYEQIGRQCMLLVGSGSLACSQHTGGPPSAFTILYCECASSFLPSAREPDLMQICP